MVDDHFDYARWASNLRDRLVQHDARYRAWDALDGTDLLAFEDGRPGTAADAARLEAVQGLAEVMRALCDLPVFSRDPSGSGLKPIADLAAAVAGLQYGHASALLETRKLERDERVPEHVGDFRKGQRQASACFVVELLTYAGSPSAGKDAAALLGSYGLTGRKKVHGILPPISHKTLEKWASEIAGDEPGSDRRRFLDQLRETFLSADTLSNEDARVLARVFAQRTKAL